MATTGQTSSPTQEPGFSVREGANWSEYLAFRPLYPPSFFASIYEYHSQKPHAALSTAHDIGAGCGVVSSTLATCFQHVIVSDPNDGYATLARKLLVDDSGIPESTFTFLKEGAEKSSVETGTVDLITACEVMHWTDVDSALSEFARELKDGGTLVMSYYTFPRIIGNEEAQKIWRQILRAFGERAKGELYDRAAGIVNSGFKCVGFPNTEWEKVNRVYINAGGSTKSFEIDSRVAQSRVKKGEGMVWIENDKDWSDVQHIDWLKSYLATFVPRMPESEVQTLWNRLETAVDGGKVSLDLPLVMIYATKKALHV